MVHLEQGLQISISVSRDLASLIEWSSLSGAVQTPTNVTKSQLLFFDSKRHIIFLGVPLCPNIYLVLQSFSPVVEAVLMSHDSGPGFVSVH